jgi:hypothetical protein
MPNQSAIDSAPVPPSRYLSLDEGDRQMVLMALAHLAVEHHGWDYALNRIALQIDNKRDGRAALYDEFRELHANR